MNLEHEREEADRWISETASVLGDTVRAQGALRAVLLAMRDSLTIPEAATFGNPMPVLVRGVYTHAWEPDSKREPFLDRVAAGLTGLGIDPETATHAVFQAIDRLMGGFPALADFQPHRKAHEDKSPEKLEKEIQAAADRASLDGAPTAELPGLPETPVQRTPESSMFADSVQELDLWIKELMDQTGWTSPDQTLAALRAVLTVLRDRITADQAIHLGTRLPTALRGYFFQEWDPGKPHTSKDFMKLVASHISNITPEEATGAVFHLLTRKLTDGGLRDLRTRRRLSPDRSRATGKR